jgi:parvulin-like peptidyl-prolyl isomerase
MRKLLLFCSVLVVFAACGKKEDKKVVIKVGNDKMTYSALERRFADAPATLQGYLNTESGRKQFMDLLVRERIMVESAKEAGYDKKAEYKESLKNYEQEQEKQLKEYRENLLVEMFVKDLHTGKIAPTEQEVTKYYEEYKEEYKRPLEIKAKHILLASRAEAEKIVAELKNGANFSKLAKEYSIDPISAQRGGEIGPFTKGDLIPEFEKAVFPLKVGQISDIVETQFGFHIITKVSEKVLPSRSMEDAKEDIKRLLEKQKFDVWLEAEKQKLGVNADYNVLTKISEKIAERAQLMASQQQQLQKQLKAKSK